MPTAPERGAGLTSPLSHQYDQADTPIRYRPEWIGANPIRPWNASPKVRVMPTVEGSLKTPARSASPRPLYLPPKAHLPFGKGPSALVAEGIGKRESSYFLS